ncbi:hypothetical protein RHO12_00960 [Orbus sturtevantii]|uniref:hypothetical protein n=1 Tax=Orbus sturtevantii TaxID=3074109 RepID=UPI00370D0FAE
MNTQTITNNKFTIAKTQKIPFGGDIPVHTQVIKRPVEVILTLGIFFDGTNNNAHNTQIRKNYEQQSGQLETIM